MVAEREIRAKEIVTDILSGIGDDELMQKYRLTFRGLQSVFRKLVDSNIIEAEFLQGRLVPQLNGEKTVIARSPRKEIYVPLPGTRPSQSRCAGHGHQHQRARPGSEGTQGRS